ncbi:hypothetical protein CU041_02505 [Thalassospira povalilytica]|uniref:DUF2946 domain-containing protein n=1 Tax=Thalassospira povalilytica TaxID=732237 RepID=A0ABX4REE8_9PROT|nr:hypothetical protein CU041_02505 [Thalassospira povalilytica]
MRSIMEKMLRTFLVFLIALSLTGTGVAQAFSHVTKHATPTDLVQITICSADQNPVTILIDRNGNKVPAPVECDCPNCMNCLNGSALELPNKTDAFGHPRAVIRATVPLSFDHADTAPTAPASARAPPYKV